MVDEIARRTFCGGVLALPVAAAAQRAGPRQEREFPGWGIMGEWAGTAQIQWFTVEGQRLPQIRFIDWEVPGRVLAVTVVRRGSRDTFYYTSQRDGTITTVVIDQLRLIRVMSDGSFTSTYTFRDAPVREVVQQLAVGTYRSTRTIGQERDIGERQRIDRAEALTLAERLYPAEYGNAEPTVGTASTHSPSASPARPRPGSRRNFALVVGINDYSTLTDLQNPVNDARAVASELRRTGFDTDLVLNADLRSLQAAVQRLAERMRAGGGSNAAGLFYFAGHGLASGPANYLVPTNASIVDSMELEAQAVRAEVAILQMEGSGSSTNIMILDACRNLPVNRAAEGTIQRGLAQFSAPRGSFIAYSTAPGAVAADGEGTNSPFATALIQQLRRPRQSIENVFRNVRRSVVEATSGEQTPWDTSSLVEPFYFG